MTRELSIRTVRVWVALAVIASVLLAGAVLGLLTCLYLAVLR